MNNLKNDAQVFSVFRPRLGVLSHQFTVASDNGQSIVEIVRQQAQSVS
jgi:hypothetical protein